MDAFLTELLPQVAADRRILAGDLITTTLGQAGKAFSETPRTDAEITAWADAMADMFCAYLERLR